MNKLRIFAVASAIILALAACSGGAAPPTSGPTESPLLTPPAAPTDDPSPTAPQVAKVRIGLDSFGGAAPVYAAQQHGFFSAQAIDATIDTYSVGLDTLNAALAGTEDFGWAFDYGSLGAMSADQLRYVATLARTNPGFHQLALTDRVASPAELVGKRLGIVIGTQQHYVTLKFIEKLGIAEDQVELVPFGAILEIVAAMRTGQVDGAWVFGQGIGEAQQISGVTIAASDGEVLPGGRGFLIATRVIVEEEPDVVRRVLAALIEADVWIQANDPDLSATAVYIADALNAPVDGVLQNLGRTEVTVSFDSSDLALLEEFAAFRTSQSPDRPLDVSKYLASEFLREIDPARVTVP